MSDLEHPDALVIESDAPEAEEPAPRKKRKASTSPTARTLEECRKRGWIAGVVERHSPFPKPFGKKHDFLGMIDLVAIDTGVSWQCITGCGRKQRGQTIGIQACSDGRTGAGGRGSDLAARRAKILAEPRARAWVEAGNRLEIWAWGSRVVGKGRRWRVRIERFEVRDGRLVGIEVEALAAIGAVTPGAA